MEEEYVRTKKDGICKLLDAEIDGSGLWCGYTDKPFWLRKDNIEKESTDIIDLVKKGDYVNGHLVKAVYLDGPRKYIKLDNAYENGKGIRTYSEDIKTIVTKEQFKAAEYEV